MTNKFPRGKLCADDEGELTLRIGVADKAIFIDFGKPTKWIGLDYDTSVQLAGRILKAAKLLKGPHST